MPHSSVFTYGISKPYAYRWFTPVTITGGFVALTLFSLLNFVSNGYYLRTETVINPNITLSSAEWLGKWPSYFTSQLQPTCQTVDVQVNSQFFTNQTGLTYTVKSVWQESPDNAGDRNITSSITYLNNVIQNCSIDTVQVDFDAEGRTAAQFGWRRWGENVIAFVTCVIQNESGLVHFSLTAEYNLVTPTSGFPNGPSSSLFSFLNINNQTKASLWWGQSLLSIYWSQTSWNLERLQNLDENLDPLKGTVYLTRNSSNTNDMTDLAFFNVDSRFLTRVPGYATNGIMPTPSSSDLNGSAVSISSLDRFSIAPNIWVDTDSLAKSMYSAVMTDLGQAQQPNILLNETSLQYFTVNFSGASENLVNLIVGPALESFLTLSNQTGGLGTYPAVIFTKYNCQVPQRKSTGALIIALLLADLVFMQALWILFRFIVGIFNSRQDPRANYCEGCLDQKNDRDINMDVLPVLHQRASNDEDNTMDRESEEEVDLGENRQNSRFSLKRKPIAYSRIQEPLSQISGTEF